MKLKLLFIGLLLSGLGLNLQAQFMTYPVSVRTTVQSPSTPYAPAYYTGIPTKLQCSITNNDHQHGPLEVVIRISITSNAGFHLYTPEYLWVLRATLDPGMAYTLPPDEIARFFRTENYDCTFKGDFMRNPQFPDGSYRFNFVVYSVNRPTQPLSDTRQGYASVIIRMGEPPRPMQPKDKSVESEQIPPRIHFSWQPAVNFSMSKPIEYEFSMVKLYDKSVPAEGAFDFSPVIYRERFRTTMFDYDVFKPLLTPGFRYAWRVRAVPQADVNPEDAPFFKNNGYSQVFWFDYAADCKQVNNLGVLCEDNIAIVTWNDVFAMETIVEYRKKGSSDWRQGVITQPEKCVISNLPYGKEYEYRVGTRCAINDVFQYSSVKGFKVPDQPDRSAANNPKCGMMPDSKIKNKKAIEQLIPGVPVLAGDFPVFITKVTGSKTFSGEGYVGIPFLNGMQVAVTFNNITVNTDHQLIGGFFETRYDAKNNMVANVDEVLNGGKGVGDVRTGEEKAACKVDYSINPNSKVLPIKPDGTKDEIQEGQDYTWTKGENGKYTFIVQDADGQEHTVETDTIPVTIIDAEGNNFVVDNGGNFAQELANDATPKEIIVTEEEIEQFKNQIIKELVADIKSKIDINAYSGTNRKYLEGAIKNTEFIIKNTIFVPYANITATGWYTDGKLYIMYTGNETIGDVKVTLFHEYLHCINYLYKIFPYRYVDEEKRMYFTKEDDCLFFQKPTIQAIYNRFMNTLNTRIMEESWTDEYSDLTEEQKQEVLEYKEKNKEAFDKEECGRGTYKPSNYYRDELDIYEICFKLDKILFDMSEMKKSLYRNTVSNYEMNKGVSIKYENTNNINEMGYEQK